MYVSDGVSEDNMKSYFEQYTSKDMSMPSDDPAWLQRKSCAPIQGAASDKDFHSRATKDPTGGSIGPTYPMIYIIFIFYLSIINLRRQMGPWAHCEIFYVEEDKASLNFFTTAIQKQYPIPRTLELKKTVVRRQTPHMKSGESPRHQSPSCEASKMYQSKPQRAEWKPEIFMSTSSGREKKYV